MNLLGREGYGTTMTNSRDRFPDGLKPYLHHEMVQPGCPKAKAMRFEMPIVAIKQVPVPADDESAKAYTRTMVSFQSTGATNICGVNNLPSVSLYQNESGGKDIANECGALNKMRQGRPILAIIMVLTILII
jgi:hypothetical protein